MRGISVWLFSKIVMLIFLFLIFSTVLSLMNMLSERAYADAAEVITMNAKDAIQGVMTTGALSGQRVVPLPKRIPEGIEGGRTRDYTLVLTRQGNSISIAIAWGTFIRISDIRGYVTASLLYIEPNAVIDMPDPLVLDSDSFRFFVANKTTKAGVSEVYIGGCRKTGLTDCT